MGDHGRNPIPELTSAGLRRNDRWAVVGQTGSGKSQLALRFLASTDYPNVIAWDTKNDSLKGAGNFWPWIPWARIITRVEQLSDYTGGKVILRLDAEQRTPEHYAAVLEWSLTWSQVNEEIGGLVVEIDEVYELVRQGKAAIKALEKGLTEGRSYGLGLILCSQRPTRLPLFIISEAQVYVIFKLRLKRDRMRMAECMQIDHDFPVPPGKHGFYWFQEEWDAPLLVSEGINLEEGVKAHGR